MLTVKGKHAVLEAVKSDAKIDRILVDHKLQQDQEIQYIVRLAHSKKIKTQILSSEQFAKITNQTQTQGVFAYQHAKEAPQLESILANPADYPFIVVVDHIEDPYNFGAIIRTCEALGVNAILYPKDRNCQFTPGVLKVASGATQYIPLVKVTNLSRSLEKLKAIGFWVYSAEVHRGEKLGDIEPNFPLILVIGNEHKGVSHGISKLIDQGINIEMFGKTESLNVSVATGILVYQLAMRDRR